MICMTESDFIRLKCRVNSEPECVGYNDDYEIYLSTEGGEYVISVLLDGEVVDETIVDCWKDIEEFIEAYFYNDISEEEEHELEIEEWEDMLDDNVDRFISSVVDDEGYDIDIIRECKEHFLEYLYRKFGFQIRRPMILEDEDGKDFYEEYPYECMVFEDEDNPIYKRVFAV